MIYVSNIIISLICLAFFSGMEVAFISSNKLRFELDKKYNNLTSSIISIFYKNSQQFISTMLVGKFLSMVVFGLLITESLTFAFEGALSPFISILLQITIATVVIIIVGEFLPRAFFKINPNMWLRLFSWVLLFFYIVLYPISWFSSWASSKFFSLFKISLPASTEENVFSRIYLNYLLQENLDTKNDQKEMEHEVKIFQKALDFSTVKLRDCFVPRTEIVALEYGVDVNILKQTFIETGLSKIIIYKGDIDNITGYIHSSEMFEHRKDWTKYIRQIPIVPENMAAQKLMKIFMSEKKSIAVVVDEFGGTAGIVTLEDIMEEIFGDIEDEHDIRGYTAEKTCENEYLFAGRLEVEEVNKLFSLNIPVSDDYTTIAGYILHIHQHFPKLNEIIRIENFTFKCVKVTNNRIEMVKLLVNN